MTGATPRSRINCVNNPICSCCTISLYPFLITQLIVFMEAENSTRLSNSPRNREPPSLSLTPDDSATSELRRLDAASMKEKIQQNIRVLIDVCHDVRAECVSSTRKQDGGKDKVTSTSPEAATYQRVFAQVTFSTPDCIMLTCCGPRNLNDSPLTFAGHPG